MFMSSNDEEAKDNAVIGINDEETGETYVRAAGKKWAGQ